MIVLCSFVLAGCGQVTGKCDSCGKEAPLYKVEASVPSSNSVDILCKTCVVDIKKAYDLAKDMGLDASISVTEYMGK